MEEPAGFLGGPPGSLKSTHYNPRRNISSCAVAKTNRGLRVFLPGADQVGLPEVYLTHVCRYERFRNSGRMGEPEVIES